MPFVPNSAPLDYRFTILPGGDTVEFDAYFNNINARFSPVWQTYKEVARADPKLLYNEFAKEVDIDFHAVAEGNGKTTDVIFDRLETLAKGISPTYYPGLGYQGNFVMFTIGRIYRQQVGYITNLQYSWENDKTSWDAQLPMLTRVNMTIAWIGRRMPQTPTPYFRF